MIIVHRSKNRTFDLSFNLDFSYFQHFVRSNLIIIENALCITLNGTFTITRENIIEGKLAALVNLADTICFHGG